jgi:PRC-barrel domain
MTSGDPVSWFVIEAGWKVVDASGQEVGSVDEVVGDSGDDIFNGLSVSTGLLSRPVYVPSEQVGLITQGRVELKLTKDQVRNLSEYEEPPTSVEIEPESAGAFTRAEAAVEAPIHSHEERLNLVTRIVHAVRRAFGRG